MEMLVEETGGRAVDVLLLQEPYDGYGRVKCVGGQRFFKEVARGRVWSAIRMKESIGVVMDEMETDKFVVVVKTVLDEEEWIWVSVY